MACQRGDSLSRNEKAAFAGSLLLITPRTFTRGGE
jgi:hypothetical protein